MKNRPLKHKKENAFQFKTFSERIAEVDIRRSALYHVGHENEALEENQSYFHQTFQKWSALNLTEEYRLFQAPLRNIVTLPQLLHKKSFIMDHLLRSLDSSTRLSLQPILEFVVVLAKDLREEFCPYFMDILDKLIEHLDTNDTDQLEWTLLCLAFLFKIQRGFLRKCLDVIFERIIKLLDEQKPLHINNFAAECFGFIARDVKNKRELVLMVANAAVRVPTTVTGSGRLMFEIMRGVNGQFHSCALQFWQVLFVEMTRKGVGFAQSVLFQVLVQTVTDMVQCIASNNLQPFWESTYECISSLLSDTEASCSDETALQHILHLVGIVAEHNRGKGLQDNDTLIGLLVKIIHRARSEQTLFSVTKIVVVMLLSKHVRITQLEASRLTKNIMRTGPAFKDTFEEFVLNVVDYSMFESLILPDYLHYFENFFNTASLQLLSQIVTRKAPLELHGMNLCEWKRFPIRLHSAHIRKQIFQLLKDRQDSDHEFQLCLILLPHLLDFDGDESVGQLLEERVKLLFCTPVDKFDTNQCFVLGLLTQCMARLSKITPAVFVRIVSEILPLVSVTKKESLIKIINLCLAKLEQDGQHCLSDDLFDSVHRHLRDFLGSPRHETRLLVAHSFTQFRHLSKLRVRDEPQILFEIIHGVEVVEPTIQTYREQIMLLKKLESDSTFMQNMSHECDFPMDAMRFALSLFSVNFKLLWEPAAEVLQTYADEFPVEDFWNLYKRQLDLVLENTINKRLAQPELDDLDSCNGLQSLQSIKSGFWDSSAKIDYVNYRVQLLVTLSKFNRIFEAKNRDIVVSFFKFIQDEYRVRQTGSNRPEDTQDQLPKATQKILLAYLNMFAKMRNPKTVYKSNQLYEFYLELITHSCFEVKKLALDCIFTYNNSAIVPYKEHLYRFNSDQTVKQEMQTFFLEDPSNEAGLRCVILDEHRAEAVPLLMKILHTKMIQKSTPSELKDALLRFIGNFREEEINFFVSMSFRYFENMLQTDPLQTILHVAGSGACFGEDLSMQRLNALVNLIDSILKDLAGSKDLAFTRRLLHLKLCMDCTLLHMDHSVVKPLKTRTLSSLVVFFEHFESYEWSHCEIEAVFRIYVWPQLGKFESDCLHSPTPLMKLFVSWSNNPRHHALLARCSTDPGIPECSSPLAHTINLLSAEKANESIVKEICKIIINLLTLDSPNQEDNKYSAQEQLSLGTSLLVPFFSNILSHLERSIMRRRSISKDLLYILSNLAEHAKTGEACDTLVGMLLQITIKKVAFQHLEAELVRDLHSTVFSLMKQLDRPEKYLRQLGTLLERVRDPVTRKTICLMVNLVAEKSSNAVHGQCAQLVGDMNKMDKRWLDQPDYECQLGAFRALDRQISGGQEIGIDLAILMAHQCFYYLSTEKDLAVRDNAIQCLRKLTVATIRQLRPASPNADVHYFIERIMLNALMKGIKDKNAATRNESIQLLGDLSRECNSYGGVLADLYPFTSSQDREIDFFDNITHLQMHRHRRAMNRFCKVAASLTSLPSTRTLVHFVLPIVSSYLCNEKYRKKAKLTEAAGHCVVTIARMLPWSSYKVLLKHYVNRMKLSLEYQKQLIKLVAGLLDNFHYDLSKADTKYLSDTNEATGELETKDGSEQDGPPPDSESIEDDSDADSTKHDEPSLEANGASHRDPSVLSKETATAVTRDITMQLIPDLLCAFNFREMPAGIKLNERKERYNREKSEMLKIPIAIAITKLLQKLPPRCMDQTLSKLLIKVMNFLKSNLKQVRSMARETLKSMLQTVGPAYLRMTLENLASILKRGFQVHVLIVTVHTLLDALKEHLTPAVVDGVLHTVLSMCINDIFGLLSEEKGISSVTSKTPEAKPSKKSFLSLQILARSMSEKSTLAIILPFKEIIAKATSRKVIANIDEALSKIADGICANPGISVKSMLIFVYGITSDSIPDLACAAGQMSAVKRKDKREVPNTFLIAAEPKRRGTFNQVATRTNSKTNAHLFVEMGLEILLTLIKRNQVLSLDYESFLDPLVPILIDAMTSVYTKMTALSVKCICSIWSSKLELSSMKQNISTIVDTILGILHKYATAVISSSDENFQLVKGSFRAMVALLKFVKYFTVSHEQLTTLLLYVEQDLYNPEKSTMALILMRSIVGAKLVVPEMAAIMKKVAEQSIINASLKTREECRLIALEYMMNYPLGSNVDHTIQFFISQLEYEELFGRESAVLMLHAVVRAFPLNVLKQRASLLFLSVGIRLVNEESSNCRQLVAECIECLLSRLDKPHLDELFDLTLEVFQNNRGHHRELAAQLAIRMMNVERDSFRGRIGKLFPVLLAAVSNVESDGAAGRFVKLKPADATNGPCPSDHKAKDHALIQALNALCALFQACPTALEFECDEFDSQMDELAYNLQTLLSHAHQWVRYKALDLLAKVLHTVNSETVHTILRGDSVHQRSDRRAFIYSDPTSELKSLVLDLCTQLVPMQTEEDVMALVAENLLIIANLLKAVPLQTSAERHSDGSIDDAKSINLLWLVRRIRYVIQSEVSKAPTSIALRQHLFQWMEAVVELLDPDTVLVLAPSMLSPVVRETSDEEHLGDNLKETVLRLSRAIKTKIGVERFDKIHLRVLASVQAKRVARQRAVATEKINHPVLAAKRKTTDRARKSRVKKRKVDKINLLGGKQTAKTQKAGMKRRRLEDLFQ